MLQNAFLGECLCCGDSCYWVGYVLGRLRAFIFLHLRDTAATFSYPRHNLPPYRTFFQPVAFTMSCEELLTYQSSSGLFLLCSLDGRYQAIV